MRFTLPTRPVVPFVSKTTRTTCGPLVSEIPDAVTEVHSCQPPVPGMDSADVTAVPSTSTWNVPPVPGDATRTSRAKVPAVGTDTVYFSHSLADTQPIE